MTGRVIVVGGGLAGLSAVMRLAEKGCHVDLVSLVKVKRSHSVCAQGGINAAFNLKDEQDSPYIHAYDTLKGGEFLANQPPVLEMCLAAPAIVQKMDRLGCPFNRTPAGTLDVRRFGGTLYHRTAFCGASTGQQLLYTLDEQVRRFEAKGQVEKWESHEFMRLILDEEGRARGIVLMDLFNRRIFTLEGDAVVFATGGIGALFKKSTNSMICTGAANGRLFMQGMRYANGEFVQIHPTAIPGKDKYRLVSESVRGEGGRVWVWGDSSKRLLGPKGLEVPCGKTGEPWYFLEEMYPGYGNLLARDIASREILRICELGMGIDGKDQVYLDVTHLPAATRHKIASVLEIYHKYTGEDPATQPMRIFPAVHYTMGGAWVDWPASDDADREERFRHMTNIPGCFQAGESEYQYHGANRLGANALLSCMFAGLTVGVEVPRYLEGLAVRGVAGRIVERERREVERFRDELLSFDGDENVHVLHDALADLLVRHVTVKRNNRDLAQTIREIKEIRERFRRIKLDDTGVYANQTFQLAAQFPAMLELSLAIAKSALYRNEFRGAHFKPEFPERDDAHWLKTTLATYHVDEPTISYEPVDTRHFDPTEKRDYTVAKKGGHTPKNLPNKIVSPL